jgi:hypothetical protein
MTSLSLPSHAIPALVADIGRLVGVLTGDNDHLSIDFDWFGNCLSNLEQVPSRRTEQWNLLGDLLGTPAYSPTGQQWYALPFSGTETPIYLVLQPAPGGASGGAVGIGLLNQRAEGPASLTASAFAPVFNNAAGGPFVVTGTVSFPVVLSLICTLDKVLTVGAYSFNALALDCRIFFDGSAPSFSLSFSGPNGSLPAIDGLQRLLAADATDWVNAALGDPFLKAWLDTPLGGSSITVGAAFADAGILNSSHGAYTLGDLSAFVAKTPVEIAETLLAAGLKALASNTKPILPIGSGGIWVFGESSANGTEYGLRLHIEDVALATIGGTQFKLQFGKMLEADTDQSSWVSRGNPPVGAVVEPGVSLTLLSESNDNTPVPSFSLALDLISIGLDIAGTGGDPLFDVEGVTLGSVQPRFLYSWNLSDGSVYWGAAVQADQLGLPLGDGFGSVGGNPVAQNLLSSGSSTSGGDKEKVNPAFSLSVSGMSHPKSSISLDVELHSDSGSGDQIWIPVQRAFGPLQCRRIGVEWPSDNPNNRVNFLFDGDVSLAALKIDLEALSLAIPLTSPGDIGSYGLDLQGMGISYASGPLTVSGGFFKVAGTPTKYDGTALISAADWSVSAIGSYATLNGQPSMFIFAQLGYELGGPPFFFVTGLCAGFGYNRSLRIPGQDEVPQFPLLAGIADPTKIGGSGATPEQALAALESGQWITPTQGVDWIAAGVQFTSFELVKSNVVVTAIMAEDFEAAVLGVSRIKLGQTGPQFAYAELGLSVVIRPADGYIGASAVLSPNSYLLTSDCHLTGGFAFWIWYDHEHAGDFVITLGGYHPAFNPPPHYPIEQRLGFSWQVDSDITVQGDAYFALTPSCAMGGGELQVLFHSGDLRAWFTAQADFLFMWKPFYFVGDVSVSIGASYKIDLLFTSVTVSVELGASLDIWGPPTGGNVHVSWYIISFSVGFGADGPKQLDGFQTWGNFVTLLPKRPSEQQTSRKRIALARDASADPTDPAASGVITLAISAGLLRIDQDDWLVRGDSMSFSISTPVPATSAVLDGSEPYTYTTPSPGDQVAIRPMGVASATSVLTISITGPEPKDTVELGQVWAWSPVFGAVPESLWGAPLPAGTTPATPSANTLPSRLVGISGLTPPEAALTGPAAFPQADLDFFVIDDGNSDWLPLAGTETAVARQPQADPTALQRIRDSITAADAVKRRGDMLSALVGFGYDPGANGDMSALRDNVDLNYADAPMIGAPWQEAA